MERSAGLGRRWGAEQIREDLSRDLIAREKDPKRRDRDLLERWEDLNRKTGRRRRVAARCRG